MKKVERLESATAPDGTILTLVRHDGAYSIRVGNVELMSTRRHDSEDRLAELVCAPLRSNSGVHVLIGGLGLGFTLRAALRSLAADARVVAVEIVAAVIAWNRNPDYQLGGSALSDARVDLRHDDVANVLRASRGAFDAIILDVDNGAEPLTTASNALLYQHAGVRMAAAALRADGGLAYWSSRREPKFEETLRNSGLTVEVTQVRSHANSGTRHTLYVARAADRVTKRRA